MIAKGLTRDIWKSPSSIPNPPYVMRTDLPSELQTAFRDALLSIAKEEPDAYHDLGLGDVQRVVPMSHADYLDTIAITLANDAERRKH
jgi:phosphonate transport system substrate-binding protein